MGKFLLGFIVAILVLILGGLGVAMLGLIPTNANLEPPRIERRIANEAVDASMERHAPRVTNPVPPNDQNLEDAMKLYSMNCALCHGDLDRKPAALAKSFYPPAPNLIADPPDDPEWHIFYTIRNRSALHRDARVGKDAQRAGNVEDHQLSLAYGKTSACGSGLLEDKLRSGGAERGRGKEIRV